MKGRLTKEVMGFGVQGNTKCVDLGDCGIVAWSGIYNYSHVYNCSISVVVAV